MHDFAYVFGRLLGSMLDPAVVLIAFLSAYAFRASPWFKPMAIAVAASVVVGTALLWTASGMLPYQKVHSVIFGAIAAAVWVLIARPVLRWLQRKS